MCVCDFPQARSTAYLTLTRLTVSKKRGWRWNKTLWAKKSEAKILTLFDMLFWITHSEQNSEERLIKTDLSLNESFKHICSRASSKSTRFMMFGRFHYRKKQKQAKCMDICKSLNNQTILRSGKFPVIHQRDWIDKQQTICNSNK